MNGNTDWEPLLLTLFEVYEASPSNTNKLWGIIGEVRERAVNACIPSLSPLIETLGEMRVIIAVGKGASHLPALMHSLKKSYKKVKKRLDTSG